LFSVLLEKYSDHIFDELESEDRDVFFTLIVDYFKNKTTITSDPQRSA